MVAKDPNYIKGGPRARPFVTDLVDEAPSTDKRCCYKDGCDAEVGKNIKREDGDVWEVKKCSKGHFQRRQWIADGAAFRAFQVIYGP